MDDNSKEIVIGGENLKQYGFVCFHPYDESNIKNEYLIRNVEVSLNGETGKLTRRFKIPKEFCIPLPPSQKIVDAENFHIEAFIGSEAHIEFLSQRAGWNQTSDDLYLMASFCQPGMFVANFTFRDQDIPLGSGVSLPVNEQLCWIGMILVHP